MKFSSLNKNFREFYAIGAFFGVESEYGLDIKRFLFF